jgi:hypothetical protein
MRVAGRLRFALLEHRAQLAVRDRAAHLPRSLSAGHVRRSRADVNGQARALGGR